MAEATGRGAPPRYKLYRESAGTGCIEQQVRADGVRLLREGAQEGTSVYQRACRVAPAGCGRTLFEAGRGGAGPQLAPPELEPSDLEACRGLGWKARGPLFEARIRDEGRRKHLD